MGMIFVPIERVLGRREQPIFRYEWREDLLYFLVSSLFVQVLAFLSLMPSLAILHNTDWGGFAVPSAASRCCCNSSRSCS